MSKPQQAAKNKADKLFSQVVRRAGRCDNCGSASTLQCAHWISRRYSHTRTDLDNAFCLCATCHRWFTDHPTEFGRWAVEMRGEETYQRLLRLSQCRLKFDWLVELERLRLL